jgi:hypothetical protein
MDMLYIRISFPIVDLAVQAAAERAGTTLDAAWKA